MYVIISLVSVVWSVFIIILTIKIWRACDDLAAIRRMLSHHHAMSPATNSVRYPDDKHNIADDQAVETYNVLAELHSHVAKLIETNQYVDARNYLIQTLTKKRQDLRNRYLMSPASVKTEWSEISNEGKRLFVEFNMAVPEGLFNL